MHLKASDFGNTHSRAFLREPPPQVLEHSVQGVHSVQMGQGWTLQDSVSVRSTLQGLPFGNLELIHSLTLVLVPPPQVLEHSDHSVHCPGFGHFWTLQSSMTSSSPGQNNLSFSFPKLSGKTHFLVLTLLPPPQDLVQGDQSVQGVQTGHFCSLQFLISHVSPIHPKLLLPLESLGRTQSRTRF